VTMTNRQRGDYFERQVRETLMAHGWFVIRSAGSLGIADLVALRHDRTPALVSCKLSGRIDPKERMALLDAAEMAGARAVVAMRPKGGRVLMAAVVRGTNRLVPLETLHVPTRTRVGAAT
jgi:Holliday junction resolvase